MARVVGAIAVAQIFWPIQMNLILYFAGVNLIDDGGHERHDERGARKRRGPLG